MPQQEPTVRVLTAALITPAPDARLLGMPRGVTAVCAAHLGGVSVRVRNQAVIATEPK